MTDLHRIGAVAATILLFSVQPGGARDVIFVPTPPEVVQRMLELAEVGTGDRVLDLGSGDGRIVIAAVKDFGAERAVGVDIDPDRIAESQENARKAGVEDRVEFRQEDLFETDLSNADVITMYLLQSINERLKPRLLAEAQPGARVVSHDFHMGSDWPPEHAEIVAGKRVYRWTIPARVEGEWQVQIRHPQGMREYVLDLHQDVQQIEAVARTGEDAATVKEGRIEGDQLSFALENEAEGEMDFRGKVEGETIRGVVRNGDGTEMPWQAQRVD